MYLLSNVDNLGLIFFGGIQAHSWDSMFGNDDNLKLECKISKAAIAWFLGNRWWAVSNHALYISTLGKIIEAKQYANTYISLFKINSQVMNSEKEHEEQYVDQLHRSFCLKFSSPLRFHKHFLISILPGI